MENECVITVSPRHKNNVCRSRTSSPRNFYETSSADSSSRASTPSLIQSKIPSPRISSPRISKSKANRPSALFRELSDLSPSNNNITT